jgi:hypothetical protein
MYDYQNYETTQHLMELWSPRVECVLCHKIRIETISMEPVLSFFR